MGNFGINGGVLRLTVLWFSVFIYNQGTQDKPFLHIAHIFTFLLQIFKFPVLLTYLMLEYDLPTIKNLVAVSMFKFYLYDEHSHIILLEQTSFFILRTRV